MKLVFWSLLILAAIWWFMKSKLGGGNDLTAHLQEQKALQSVGNTSLSANQTSLGNWPLTTIGDTPLAGLPIDPINSQNPFVSPRPANFWQTTPNASPYPGLLY